MRSASRVLVGLAALALGCARAPGGVGPGFRHPADTFAFANETVWEYRVDPATGATSWFERDPPPPFTLRCGNMARAARQFRVHARFAPDAPPADDATYAALVADVMTRDPRARTPSPDPVVIPGFADLRRFSAAYPAMMQDALRGPWQSYLQRGNWRMIFPFTRDRQRDEAERWRDEVARGDLPIVHVLRYPELTLNHMVLVYGVQETPSELRFTAWDPNDAEAPLVLRYDRGARAFVYPRTIYFGGGVVKAYEVYDGPLY